MRNLTTTIAAYPDLPTAEKDWAAVEAAADAHAIELADAALIEKPATVETVTIHRQSHHGWGKGAIAGAVIGVLFPPALIGAAAVGAGSGAVLARMNRSLDRGDIKDLGDVMDTGEIAVVALTHADSVPALDQMLTGATNKISRSSSTAEEVQEALAEDEKATTQA
jgi:uncharacterized membrane protein